MGSKYDSNWNLALLNDGGEYHHLSKDELLELVGEEWYRDYNAMFIGRDVDCVGRLGVFFMAQSAFVGYEDFERQLFWSAYVPSAREKANWSEMIRLSPPDTNDWSFRRSEIVSKEHAWAIVDYYLASSQTIDMWLLDADGKPTLVAQSLG